MIRYIFILVIFMGCGITGQVCGQPENIRIKTRWGAKVTSENVWQEYPRPQMERKEWQNLNGYWEYAILEQESVRPDEWQGKILVPFPVQSFLSGVGKGMTSEQCIWYKREIKIPDAWRGENVMLNFEASDWETTVWVNGQKVGQHTGGYDPFGFDITKALKKSGNEIIVKVSDPQGKRYAARGKQGAKDYVDCSGIWQGVWMEPVYEAHLQKLKITTSLDGCIFLEPTLSGAGKNMEVRCQIFAGNKFVAGCSQVPGKVMQIKVPQPRLWSPEDPFLYDVLIQVALGDKVVDEVKSYLGVRSVDIRSTEKGPQVFLNNKRIFQMGPLDQGYWPESGLTPPADEAMAWEIDYLKEIGCNMVRLHIKRNPRRWYYHCDKKGLLVWQDFICGPFRQAYEKVSSVESAEWFDEQKKLVETLYNHPSIVMWIVFNEGWGEHNTTEIVNQARKLDATRMVSAASGWDDIDGLGNVRDIHDYTFCPAIPAAGSEKARIVVLGECGGFASAVPAHNWTGRSNKGGEPKDPLVGGFDPDVPRDHNVDRDIFRPTFTAGDAFEKQYDYFIDNLVLLQNSGLAGAVYTQLTDMQFEENGWLTYDREVSKIDRQALKNIHSRLYKDIPEQYDIVPAGIDKPVEWMYTDDVTQGGNWLSAEYDCSSWKKGNSPFGMGEGGFAKDKSHWNGDTLYMKRSFTLDAVPENASLRVYSYLENVKTPAWIYVRIYINGHFVHDEVTRQFKPEYRMAEIKLRPEAMKWLKEGGNTIAVKVDPGYNPKNVRGYRMTRAVIDVSLTGITGQ